jgi:hypothetical protein
MGSMVLFLRVGECPIGLADGIAPSVPLKLTSVVRISICIFHRLRQRYDAEGWPRLMPRGYWEIYGAGLTPATGQSPSKRGMDALSAEEVGYGPGAAKR